MHFKSLELFGFKSFADRTRLDFEPGITAIVGPNGCGKSNIADAIKWVLGEQSAKMMRGGKMEDVIFNGADAKEPVNFAEVSLTLSNKDKVLPIEYDEVTITRRLYRSGESEYLLNKTQVRLKDINELFMGTGIGTSAYSLIEQGRIDQILSSKPEERREVFEEASGITKYKAKKKEALRRLEDTENNLVRINDIILEVKRQINSIERQAKKAERYKERYEELKSEELKLSRIELEALKEKLSVSNINIEEFRSRENFLSAELNKIKEGLYELNTKRSHVDAARVDLKSSIIRIDSEVSKATDKISLDRERIEELTKRRVSLEEEVRKNSENIASQEKEISSLREKLLILEKEDSEKLSVLQEKEKRFEEISNGIKINEVHLSTAKANVLDIASSQAKIRNQIAKVSTTLLSHDARLKRLAAEKKGILEEKDAIDAKLSQVVSELTAIKENLGSLRPEKDIVSNELHHIKSYLESLIVKSKEIETDLTTNKSKLEMLEQAKARYEGFSSGVKALLGKEDNKPQIPGIRDCLANILKVKKGYEASIEIAAGKYIQAIVVDNIESVEKAIAYLKEHSSGKASFILLSQFNSSSAKIEDFKDSRILGRARDFINIEDIYKNMADFIFNNIFITRNNEDARGILKDNPDSKKYTFITLGGELIENGFISGGSIKEELNLINRDSLIKEMQNLTIELERRIEELSNEKLQRELEEKTLSLKLESLVVAINEKDMILSNLDNTRLNIEENINGIRDEISLNNLEMDEVSSEIATLKQEEQSALEALTRIESDTRLNEEKIKNSEVLINEYMGEKEQILVGIVEYKTTVGSLESKKEGLASTLDILESSLRDAINNSASRKAEIDNSLEKIEGLNKEISGLEKNISILSENRLQKDAEFDDVEKVYREISEKSASSENMFREMEKEVNDIRSHAHSVDLNKAETNYAIDNLKQRMRDVYKLDLETIELSEDWRKIEKEAIKKDVEEKRVQLDSMGTVNLVAIEEHTELEDRYVFLTNQRDDLVKAKDSLLKAISEINKTTKELFIETFKNIQVEFRNFFKMLFGGGDGELILLDEGDVLECGIEIVARPPGKRLQNVSLLSGGEKALTAISLIFAIFKVKPSPFCVLDEIDAPLDESNVDRFLRSIDMFTKTSQFIVVTHNKKTIDKADIMYGITMQQSGISRVVSVRFSDAKKQQLVEEAIKGHDEDNDQLSISTQKA